MPDYENSRKYLFTGEIADRIANEVGMEEFSSHRYNSDTRASYTWEERRKIYQYITGKEGHDLTRIELNYLIMKELDSELHAGYDYEFIRKDLKIIFDYVMSHEPASSQENQELENEHR